jgi:hypothetical protein
VKRPASWVSLAAIFAISVFVIGVNRSTAVAAKTAAAFKFNPSMALLDNSGNTTGAAEPTIKVDSAGHIYVTGPLGVPNGGCPFWRVHPDSLSTTGRPYDFMGNFDTIAGLSSVGGGDCDIATGGLPPQHGYDNLGVSSLALSNMTVNQSSNGGTSFHATANPVGNPGSWGDDRQWNVADTSIGQVYMAVHDAQTDNIQMAASIDGGYTYTSNLPAIDFSTVPGAAANNTFSEPVVNAKTHRIYIAFVAGQSATDAANSIVDAVYLAVGNPCAVLCKAGSPLGPIAWTDETVYKWSGTGTPPNFSNIFPTVAIDQAGAVYVGWSDTAHIYMSHSTTPATPGSWSAPVKVDQGLSGVHSALMPWFIGGKAGIVDAVWYSSHLSGSGTSCPAGATGVADDSQGLNNNCFNVWDVEFAQTRDTGGSFATSAIAAGNHLGSLCTQGLNCNIFGGNRNLLDFFQVALDPAGAANIAYAGDNTGAVDVDYTRQCSGKSATGSAPINYSCLAFFPPPAPPSPVCGNSSNGYLAVVATDPSGDAINPSGAPGATSQADATAVSFKTSGPNLLVTLNIASIPSSPDPNAVGIQPIDGTTDTYYYVAWTFGGQTYAALAAEPQPGSSAFSYGTFDPSINQLTTVNATTGSITAGSPGTISITVPLSGVGNPTIPVASATTAAAQQPFGVITSGEGALGSGLVFTHPDDRAPNQGYGSTWSVC